MTDNNKELAIQRRIRYLLWVDNTITHVIETTEQNGVLFIVDDDDGSQYEVTIKEVNRNETKSSI